MPTLREFFATEAAEFLTQLANATRKFEMGSGDPAELQRHSKALRGTAQMAREERVYQAAQTLESAARSLAGGVLSWSADLSGRMQQTLEDLDALVRGGEADEEADSRVRRTVDRWREVGVGGAGETGPSAREVQEVNAATRQFRQFAAHEVAGIISEMDTGFELLTADPRNRDPLKSILRRERALLGSAKLNELPVISEALHATEDVTRLIAKLNAPVKEEWLGAFKAAREVLKAGLETLQSGEVPGPSPALSKLRVIRQELIERYGEPSAANSQQQSVYTPPPPGPTPPNAPVRAPDPVTARVPVTAPVPVAVTAPVSVSNEPIMIDELCYSGKAALDRALEILPQLEPLADNNEIARESLDELYDLIRLGSS